MVTKSLYNGQNIFLKDTQYKNGKAICAAEFLSDLKEQLKNLTTIDSGTITLRFF